MSLVMEDIRNVTVEPLEKGSKFVVPVRVHYTQNNRQKTWEAVRSAKSVGCVIYNTTRRKLIFVKQFRPAVYIHSVSDSVWKDGDSVVIDTTNNPPSSGITLELCAGLVDRLASLEEICVAEIHEETGYSVSKEALTKIGSCRSAVGIAGDSQTLYYAEVTDDMLTGAGGGIDEEMIEIIELSVDEVEELLSNEKTVAPPELFWGLTWFLLNKAKR